MAIGNPQPGICGSGEQRDAGLCYANCRTGFNGVGPVCWAEKPAGWVDCGMGAAKDSTTCASTVFSQVSSVGQMAMFVASLGTSSAGTQSAGAAQSAGRLAKLKAQYESQED